jgi:hypothetical protein
MGICFKGTNREFKEYLQELLSNFGPEATLAEIVRSY